MDPSRVPGPGDEAAPPRPERRGCRGSPGLPPRGDAGTGAASGPGGPPRTSLSVPTKEPPPRTDRAPPHLGRAGRAEPHTPALARCDRAAARILRRERVPLRGARVGNPSLPPRTSTGTDRRIRRGARWGVRARGRAGDTRGPSGRSAHAGPLPRSTYSEDRYLPRHSGGHGTEPRRKTHQRGAGGPRQGERLSPGAGLHPVQARPWSPHFSGAEGPTIPPEPAPPG